MHMIFGSMPYICLLLYIISIFHARFADVPFPPSYTYIHVYIYTHVHAYTTEIMHLICDSMPYICGYCMCYVHISRVGLLMSPSRLQKTGRQQQAKSTRKPSHTSAYSYVPTVHHMCPYIDLMWCRMCTWCSCIAHARMHICLCSGAYFKISGLL